MLDHIFLSVTNITRSITFYSLALVPLDITDRLDYDGKDGPPRHPDLKGFGSDGRIAFWLRKGVVKGRAVHVGFLAASEAQVNEFVFKSWQHSQHQWVRDHAER